MFRKTASLRELRDEITRAIEIFGPETLVVAYDHDTGWTLGIEPKQVFAPNKTQDGCLIFRSLGYHDEFGDNLGAVYTCD